MITFLFGSGADTCANKNLKSGASFSEGLLTGGFFEERKKSWEMKLVNINWYIPKAGKCLWSTSLIPQNTARYILRRS